MAVTIGEYQFSIGEGKSKQEAEQSAAQKALENWESLLKQYFNL
jgi:dsRNA-specific ribonuclease